VNKVYAPGTPCEECVQRGWWPNTGEWVAVASSDEAPTREMLVCDYCAEALSDPDFDDAPYWYRIEPAVFFSEAAMARARGDVDRAREAFDLGIGV
jgi:hypothetical protein